MDGNTFQSIAKIRSSRYTNNALKMQEELAHYLFTNDSVPWQMVYIRRTGQVLVNDIDSNVHIISFCLSHFVLSIISSSWHVLINIWYNYGFNIFKWEKLLSLIRLDPWRAFWFPHCIMLLVKLSAAEFVVGRGV